MSKSSLLGRRHQLRSRGKIQAHNVCWTSDDTRVITLQSVLGSKATRLKVWDSFTGDLLRVLPKVSSEVCKLVVPHPLNHAIAITGGDDGVFAGCG